MKVVYDREINVFFHADKIDDMPSGRVGRA